MRINRRALRAGLIAAVILVILVLTIPFTLPGTLRTRLADAVGERFGGTVELETLRVSVFPRPRIAGETVVVRHKGRTDLPPLITIASFSADAGLIGLLGRPIRLRAVYLDGLEINVPPGGLGGDQPDAGEDDSANGGREADDRGSQASGDERSRSPIIVDELLSENAMLRILRPMPGKRPREFAIERLAMRDTGADVPWAFEASLTNPTPPGRIDTRGTFGPWNASEPARTPLSADYEFSRADLGVFAGIRGTLQSDGRYAGVLGRIEVDGRTDVPDFALADVGRPVNLRTQFHAVVDGTNGNTWLKPVVATFGETEVHATGGVVELDGEEGRTVTLEIVMDKARIEDVLALAVKSQEPPMVGALKLKAHMELPPGDVQPIQKLKLSNGSFEIDEARFPGGGVQAKVNELSQKAQAAGDGPAEEVASDLSGRFEMEGGVIRFSRVAFAIPGARVDLAGVYTVASEALDFRGTVRLDAKLSQLTTGAKAFLLKLVEPLFRKENVTVVPVTIGGTVQEPKFGLDVKRAFTPD